MLSSLSSIARSQGDPQLVHSGPSSMGASDRLARGLGWFSIALGVTELVAAERLARTLGMRGQEALIRAYGVREIGAGVLCLSVDKNVGLWSRVAGDGLDIATLMMAMRDDNPKRDNVGLALAAVAGVTMLDLAAAQGASMRHRRGRGRPRDYRERSGFPRGVDASRGLARGDFDAPPDMRADPVLATVSDRSEAA